MTILLQIDIFYQILSKLPLRETILLRGVCFQWKEWIDNYLRKQKTLLIDDYLQGRRIYLIDDEIYHLTLTEMSQTLKLNYSRMVANRLKIPNQRNLTNKDFFESLLRTFPNIEEFYFFLDPNFETSKDIDYVPLLTGFRDSLRKLMVGHVFESAGPAFIECLNQCEKLETFGVIEVPDDNDMFLTGNEPFLSRLDSVWLPSSEWIRDLAHPLRITGFGVDMICGEDDFKDDFAGDRFPALERLYMDLSFDDWAQRGETIIWTKLQELTKMRHEQLSCFEFVFRKTYLRTTEKSSFPPFFTMLNRFPRVKTIKFQMDCSEFLESLLQNCGNFEHVETLIINYKDFGISDPLELPENFQDLLPKTVKRIQNLEIHVFRENLLGWVTNECFDVLKTVDFSGLPYRVKIFYDSP